MRPIYGVFGLLIILAVSVIAHSMPPAPIEIRSANDIPPQNPPEPAPLQTNDQKNPVNPIQPKDLSEEARMKLMEVKNEYSSIEKVQQEETTYLKTLAMKLYNKSLECYNKGDYKLSIAYSRISLEIIRAIRDLEVR